MPSIMLIAILIIFMCLINRVIGEVNERGFDVEVGGRFVLLGGEAPEALVVDEGAERGDAEDEDVEAEVKFEVVDEVGAVEVALDDVGLGAGDAF